MKAEDVRVGTSTLQTMNREIEANKAQLNALGGPAALRKKVAGLKASAKRDAEQGAKDAKDTKKKG